MPPNVYIFRKFFVCLFIGLVLVLPYGAFGAGFDDAWVIVTKVHDGDTITIKAGGRREKARLIGIDAPEMGQRPWGRRAKEHLEGLISSSSWSVSLEYDIEKRDKYGRLLVYATGKNERLINAEMVRDGYAVLFTFPPNVKHAVEFADVQRQAREGKVGIWGKNGLKKLPVDYRREHPRLR